MAFNIDEERLKALFYYTSDGVVILDSSLNIIMLNPSAEEITGWNSKEITGKKFPTNQLIYLAADQNEKDTKKLFKLSETILDLEMEVSLPNGNKVLFPAISFPIIDKEGKPFFGLLLENVLFKYGMGERLIKAERLDELTGLYNMKYFEQAAEDEMKRMRKHGGNLGGLLIQIENLSYIDHHHGKLKAGNVLKTMGQIIKGNSRDVDLVGRYSENEFVVFLIHSDSHKINIILDRLKDKINHAHQANIFPVALKINVGKALLDRQYEEIYDKLKLSLENFI